MSKKEIGTLYVLSNPCFPYLKIGYTTNSVIDRCRQLSNMQAIPLPFEIVYTAFVKDPWEVENVFDVIDERKYHLERMRKALEKAGG